MITYNTRLKEYGDMLKEAFPIVNFEITDKEDLGDETKWAFWERDDRIMCGFNPERFFLYDPKEKEWWFEDAKDFVLKTVNPGTADPF